MPVPQRRVSEGTPTVSVRTTAGVERGGLGLSLAESSAPESLWNVRGLHLGFRKVAGTQLGEGESTPGTATAGQFLNLPGREGEAARLLPSRMRGSQGFSKLRLSRSFAFPTAQTSELDLLASPGERQGIVAQKRGPE